MDEATSSLDIETESMILDQLRILKKNKTIILITHNPNTLKYCDKIFKINDGKIKKLIVINKDIRKMYTKKSLLLN